MGVNLAEYFAQNGPDAVAKAISADPAFAVFNLTWATPDELPAACRRMGWVTVDDALQWVQRVNAAMVNTAAFVNAVDPDVFVDMSAMPTIQWPDIHAAVAQQCKLREDFFLDHTDMTYRLPTRQQWEAIGAACPSTRRKWVAEVQDCDDFVRHFQGWLASKGLGNLAHGFCGTTHYRNGQMQGGHAVVLVVDAERKVWQLEPQNGKLYAPTYAQLGGFIFANEVRLARLYF